MGSVSPPSNFVPKPGMTPALQKIYDEIASRKEEQRVNYKRWLFQEMPAEFREKIQQDCKELGLKIDLETGRVSYDYSAFTPVPIHYELCYVRHGRTIGNTEPRVYQGQVDYWDNQLNEIGTQQAETAADLLDKKMTDTFWTPDLLVYSPLLRAKNTGLAFGRRHGDIPHVVIDASAEMAFGDWDNVQVKDLPHDSICHLFYLDQNAIVKSNKPHTVTDGWVSGSVPPKTGTGNGGVSGGSVEIASETFIDVLVRMRKVLLEINERPEIKGKKNAKVAMYGHSMCGAALLILLGHGKTDKNGLGFDGKFIMPNATPTFIAPVVPTPESTHL